MNNYPRKQVGVFSTAKDPLAIATAISSLTGEWILISSEQELNQILHDSSLRLLLYHVINTHDLSQLKRIIDEMKLSPLIIMAIFNRQNIQANEIPQSLPHFPEDVDTFIIRQAIDTALYISDLKKQVHDKKSLSLRILHEIKSPILVIKHQLEQVQNELPKNLQSLDFVAKLQNIRESTEKIEDIVGSMLHIENPMTSEKSQELNMTFISSLLRKIADNLEKAYRFPSAIEIDLASEVANKIIYFEPIQLEQILTNLIKNAHQACKDHSTPHIRATLTPFETTHVVLSIIDNGPGIPLDLKKHIFHEGFSTKSSEDNFGIGLPLARKLALKNQSELMLDEESSQTKFDLFLKIKSN